MSASGPFSEGMRVVSPTTKRKGTRLLPPAKPAKATLYQSFAEDFIAESLQYDNTEF